jgi:hypothetical protein
MDKNCMLQTQQTLNQILSFFCDFFFPFTQFVTCHWISHSNKVLQKKFNHLKT